MTVQNCVQCSRPVPSRRRELKDLVATLFCSNSCHLQSASAFLSATRQAELRAEDELQKELGSDWRRITSEQFVKAVDESGGNPSKVLPFFIARTVGHLAPVYGEMWLKRILKGVRDTLKGGKKKEKQPDPEDFKSEPPPAPANGTAPPVSLEDLPLGQQRAIILKRFKKLAPDATIEQIKTERARLVRTLHPDKVQSNPRAAAERMKVLTFLNVSFARLIEIDAELGRPWK